jgi:hypothetical protein
LGAEAVTYEDVAQEAEQHIRHELIAGDAHSERPLIFLGEGKIAPGLRIHSAKMMTFSALAFSIIAAGVLR